jgi:head-tail adaptor
MQIRYGSRLFEITGVVNILEQSRFLELACEERQAG